MARTDDMYDAGNSLSHCVLKISSGIKNFLRDDEVWDPEDDSEGRASEGDSVLASLC